MSTITFHDVSGFVGAVKDWGLPEFVGGFAAYARLGICGVMPEASGKMLYLDADTLVLDDLGGLYDTDIDGKLCAGVQDNFIREEYRGENGFPPGYPYMNSGVLLMNLDEWQKNFTPERVRELSGGLALRYPDQDIINKATLDTGGGRVVSPRYNVLTPYLEWDIVVLSERYPEITKSVYSVSELEAAKKNPAVVHMTDGLNGRPWHKVNTNPLSGKWREYLNESEFGADFEGHENGGGKLQRLIPWIYRNLPERVTMMIIRIREKFRRRVKR